MAQREKNNLENRKQLRYLRVIFVIGIVCLLALSKRNLHERPWFTITDSLTFLPGEYQNAVINANTQKLYSLTNLPITISGLSGYNIIAGAGGAHHIVCIDDAFNLHVLGDNLNGELGLGNNTDQSSWQLVTTDSLGNPFGNVRYAYCGGTSVGWNTMVVKWDGTVWIAGCTDGGIRGNGTGGGATNRFVQIVFSGSPFITRALVGFTGLALDNAGNMYTWGGSVGFFAPYVLAQGTPTPVTNTPTKLTSISGVRMIAGSGSNYQFAVTATHIYGWAFYAGYIGVGSQSQPYSNPDMSVTGLNPWLLDTAISITGAQIDTIACSSTGTYIKKTDGTLYYFGDNSNGGAGNGQQIDWRHYVSPGPVWNPYNWSQGPGELMVRKPVQIAPGKTDFTRIFTSSSLTFYAQFEDAMGVYYFTGRNKGGIAGNAIGGVDSVAGDLQAARPNSWQEPWITRITPFQYPHQILNTCPWYNDTTGAPLETTYPVNKTGANPVSNAGSNTATTATSFTLKGSYTYSSPARGLRTRLWSHVSGPAATMPLVAQDTTTVINMGVGTHVFKYFIMDNNFKTDSTTVTITVNPLNVINIPAGSKISVH